ncbi:MAG: SpoIIE family protein phosphatase [Bacteroidia bacterium]|nr:SpoIIE family protein phosphatase [Bacteroidia bacterium]
MNQKPYIICVDDEKVVLDQLWNQVAASLGEDFYCDVAESGEEALELIEYLLQDNNQIAIIISDYLMPTMKGDEFLIKAHHLSPDSYKILLTGQSNLTAITNVINQAKLYRYIPKPWEQQDLVLAVKEAIVSWSNNQKLLQHHQFLQSMNQVLMEISAELNAKLICDKVMHHLMRFTDAANGYVLLKDGESIRFSNYHKHPNSVPPQELLLQKVHSFVQASMLPPHVLYTPLVKGEQELGCLLLENEPEKSFLELHKDAFRILAKQATISLDNTRLYNQVNVFAQEILQKNNDLTESIYYAQRIQKALMPDLELLKSFFDDFFVFYQPKDIVSGDFYFLTKVESKLILATVDCTGHGVPGAFMSLIGHNLLNQVVVERKITYPSEIFKEIENGLNRVLYQQDNNQHDGMDLSICVFDLDSKILEFAGARNSAILVNNSTVQVLEADRFPIGGRSLYHEKVFHTHQLILREPVSIYLYTDGFQDQFGGTENRKFYPKNFKRLITSNADKPMKQQKQILESTILDWMGDKTKQTDDILVLGIRWNPCLN